MCRKNGLCLHKLMTDNQQLIPSKLVYLNNLNTQDEQSCVKLAEIYQAVLDKSLQFTNDTIFLLNHSSTSSAYPKPS